jgi:hypothetical protein
MSVNINGKDYVTTGEAAKLLHVSPGRVRQLVADGVITDVIPVDVRRNIISLIQVNDYNENRRKVGRPPNS